MSVSQITFVGHSKLRIVQSIRGLRELPVTKIILAVGKPDTSGERFARKLAGEIAGELRTVYDVEIAEVDKKNVMNAVVELVKIVEKEKRNGNEVVFNVSGSLRTFAIAGYITACVTDSRIYSSIPEYDENENEVGIEEIIEIPVLPVDFPGKEQMKILNALDGGVPSLDELVSKLNPDIKKGSKEFRSERSRLSHHIAKLEKAGFVRRKKAGKHVRIELTELGMAFTSAFPAKS